MNKILRASAWFVVAILLGLLAGLIYKGAGRLSWTFVTTMPSRIAENAGVLSAIAGSFYVMVLTTFITVPVGICAAIFLTEFAPKSAFFRFVQLNIANLAGVPSIIYGILGLALFARWMDLGRSLLAGALTLSLMALPVVILSAEEAIIAVSKNLRLSALGLGATRWQTVRDHVLPAALPGILTGIILSISRVAGETAPLIMMGAMTYVAFVPKSVMDSFTVLPIQVYNWASRPQESFQTNAAAAVLVLLAILMSMNIFALWLRYRTKRAHK